MPRKKRNYAAEYKAYQGTPDQIAKRSQRNKARRAVVAAKGASAVAGKDVDHKRPISKGGGNSLSNLRIVSPSVNRSFKRTKKGKMK